MMYFAPNQIVMQEITVCCFFNEIYYWWTMALHGEFVINDAYYSPLSFPGIGTLVPGMSKFKAYGTIEVITNGKACP